MNDRFPGRLFGFGYTGAYDFAKAGYTDEEVKELPKELAKLGCVWQVQPIWATQGLSLHAKQFAKSWVEQGIAGYMENVSKPARAQMSYDPNGKPTARGGQLADAFFDVVGGRSITGPN
jgi:isocitrate lyase